MYDITGGARFIGSNMVKRLNERGITDILVVDDLESGKNSAISDFLIRSHLALAYFLVPISGVNRIK